MISDKKIRRNRHFTKKEQCHWPFYNIWSYINFYFNVLGIKINFNFLRKIFNEEIISMICELLFYIEIFSLLISILYFIISIKKMNRVIISLHCSEEKVFRETDRGYEEKNI